MRKLLTIAIVVLLAATVMAVDLDSDSAPVNLKIMPVATVTAPAGIDVEIMEIDTVTGKGKSSGDDFGTFLISTNLALLTAEASIGSRGLSGGTWRCRPQGGVWSVPPNPVSRSLSGPIPADTPFDIFVQVYAVDMTAIPFEDVFVWDTTLTLTLSVP